MSRPRLIALLLALATLVIYLPVTHYDFINYDDPDYVTKNPMVQQGPTWAGVQWAFISFHASNWHPLTWLSHMVDCELFGLNAGGHHFVNVLFHAANAVLLLALMLRLTGALWPAAFVAALFAWHPLHVESVAWISERKDVLSTFFALLTLLAYARYARDASRRFFWLALGFFALGLMSKPMLVTLPFGMLLLDFWPLARMRGGSLPVSSNPVLELRPEPFYRLLLEKWPFFLLAFGSCIATFLAQRGTAISSLETVPLSLRLENVATAYVTYLSKFFWPSDLAVIYPLAKHIPAAIVAGAVITLACITAGSWLARQRAPYVLVGWLWFLGTLVPVIGLIQVGGQALADRYTYVPSIGIFIIIAFGAADLISRLQIPKAAAAIVAVIILVTCIGVTETQLRYWQNSETLFRHTLAVTKNNEIAHNNLGAALELEGKYDEAIVECRAALQIAPDRYQGHNNLGDCLNLSGRPAEALVEYREAIRLNPNVSYIHQSLGTVLAKLGDNSQALAAFTNAARLDPASPWPHFNMAKILLQQGRNADAANELRQALRCSPNDVQILTYTAHVLAAIDDPQVRDGKTALTLANEASNLTGGGQVLVLAALGMAQAETGDFANALATAQKALDLTSAADNENLPSQQRLLQQKAKRELEQQLQLYRNHQPWRESFQADNTPAKP